MTSSDAAPAGSPWRAFGATGALLERAGAGTRVASAYLFEGDDREAPRAAARLFAATLLCREARRPCLACGTCRRVVAGSHPDVHVRGRDKATVISVAALAEVLERAHGSPREGTRQVFTIDPADALAPEAAAMYLKSLEEPPPTTTFLLVTARPDRLPATVRSRCQRFRFPPPSDEAIAARLVREGADGERAARLARAASGSPTRASRLLVLEVDRAIETLARAASARVSTAATTGEAVLASLRARAGSVAEPEARAGEAPEGGATAGEALRRALDDLFHALSCAARDRASGRATGLVDGLSPSAAARALPVLAGLGADVRRNVSPISLVIDAIRALRRA